MGRCRCRLRSCSIGAPLAALLLLLCDRVRGSGESDERGPPHLPCFGHRGVQGLPSPSASPHAQLSNCPSPHSRAATPPAFTFQIPDSRVQDSAWRSDSDAIDPFAMLESVRCHHQRKTPDTPPAPRNMPTKHDTLKAEGLDSLGLHDSYPCSTTFVFTISHRLFPLHYPLVDATSDPREQNNARSLPVPGQASESQSWHHVLEGPILLGYLSNLIYRMRSPLARLAPARHHEVTDHRPLHHSPPDAARSRCRPVAPDDRSW